MRKPKVQRLYYEITGGQNLTYDRPPTLDFSNDVAHFGTEDGILRAEPSAHFGRESDARAAVESFLDVWETWANLESQTLDTLAFAFLRSEIVDLDPPTPGEPQMIYLEAAGVSFCSGEVTLHIRRSSYPPPPELTALGPDVESVYYRWVGYKEGREPL